MFGMKNKCLSLCELVTGTFYCNLHRICDLHLPHALLIIPVSVTLTIIRSRGCAVVLRRDT